MSKPFDIGTRAGKYEIIGILGAGGMGVVYEARHVELKKRVALKTLHPEYAQHPVAQARFVREGEAASRIRHPHVVDVTDLGNHEGVPYLVMEYLEGMDLSVYLTQRESLPIGETLDLMLPVVAAVAAGHDEGVIHRDLKPHNIFLVSGRHHDMHPKVLDFGVSKVSEPLTGESNLTATSAMMGTVAYMSPEQAMGAKLVDGRSDQYALALIIYECVTGRRAHEGDNTLAVLRQIGDGAIEPPSAYLGEVPREFEEVLMRALSLEPRNRYQSMYEFGRALLPFATPKSERWLPTFQREPAPASVAVVAAVEDKQPSSTRARTARGVSPPRAPGAPPSQPAIDPTAPPVMFPKTMALPQAMAVPVQGAAAPAPGHGTGQGARQSLGQLPRQSPVRTTLGESAAELVSLTAPPARSRRPLFAVGGAGAAALVIALVVMKSGGKGPGPVPVAVPAAPVTTPATATPTPMQPPAPAPPVPAAPRTFRAVVNVSPAEAQLELDGLPIGRGTLDRELTADGRTHSLVASAPGFESQTVTFVDQPPPPSLELIRKVAARPEARRRPAARTVAPGPKAKAPNVGANQAPILKE